MKSAFYYGGEYLGIAARIKDYLNNTGEFLSPEIADSTRYVLIKSIRGLDQIRKSEVCF